MAKYIDVHPDNPQPRAIGQVAETVRQGGLIVYPTDSCFALGCQLGSRDGIERIRFASPHPRHTTDRVIAAVRDLPKVCKHLHLPVQSGSTRLLGQMRRR